MAANDKEIALYLRVKEDGSYAVRLDKAAKKVEKLGDTADRVSKKNKGLANSIQGVGRAASVVQGPLGPFAGRLSALSSIIGGFNPIVIGATTAIGGLGMAMAKGVEDGIAYERMMNVLQASTGNAGDAFKFLDEEAKRLGVNLEASAGSFAKFSAASRGTALEGEGARKVFSGVMTAASAMGLSADQSAGALKALEQMMSKGNVQAEELRGQLGERIPGAFNLAARAMGVTTSQLNKMLDNGEVLATDLLPKLAAVMQNEFADGAEAMAGSTQASLNRLSNSWFKLGVAISESGVSEAFAGIVDAMTDIVDATAEVIRWFDKLNENDVWKKQSEDTKQLLFLTQKLMATEALHYKEGTKAYENWQKRVAKLNADIDAIVNKVADEEAKAAKNKPKKDIQPEVNEKLEKLVARHVKFFDKMDNLQRTRGQSRTEEIKAQYDIRREEVQKRLDEILLAEGINNEQVLTASREASQAMLALKRAEAAELAKIEADRVTPEEATAINLGQQNAEKIQAMQEFYAELNTMAEEQGMTEAERETADYEAKMERIMEHRQFLIDQDLYDNEAAAEAKQAELDAEIAHQDALLAIKARAGDIEAKAAIQAAKFREMIKKGEYGNALSMAMDFAAKSGLLSKKQFEMVKKVQMGIAIVKGVGTVINAYENGSKYGGIYGAAFEGAIAASMVAMQVMQIKSASMGGGSAPTASSAGGMSMPSVPTPTAPAAPVTEQASQAPVTNVYMNGTFVDMAEFMGSGVVPALQDQLNNGSVVLFNNQSAQAGVLAG